MAVKLTGIWIFLWILRATVGCEDSFEIGSEELERGNEVVFKNNTTVAKNQHLTWEFKANNKKFIHSVVMSPTGDILKGFFKYEADEKNLGLVWVKEDNNDVSYALVGDLGSALLKWNIILQNCQKFEYQLEINGQWWYKIGEITVTNAEESQREVDYSGQVFAESSIKKLRTFLMRTKRESDESQVPVSESEPWYKKVYNFFFGSGSARRNESAGILTKMMNWVRDLSCKLHGPCDRDEPIGHNKPSTPDFVNNASPLPPLQLLSDAS